MEIILSPTSFKRISKIPPKDRKKVDKKIETLKSDPLSGQPLKGKFLGLRSLKAWPLRIIYEFDDKSQVINVVDIDYRGQVYK